MSIHGVNGNRFFGNKLICIHEMQIHEVTCSQNDGSELNDKLPASIRALYRDLAGMLQLDV